MNEYQETSEGYRWAHVFLSESFAVTAIEVQQRRRRVSAAEAGVLLMAERRDVGEDGIAEFLREGEDEGAEGVWCHWLLCHFVGLLGSIA